MSEEILKRATAIKAAADRFHNKNWEIGAKDIIDRVVFLSNNGYLPEQLPPTNLPLFDPEVDKALTFVAEPRYLSTREAAERIGCGIDNVKRLIRKGQLPATKIGPQWAIDREDASSYFSSKRSSSRKKILQKKPLYNNN